jgi:hypothetical protein
MTNECECVPAVNKWTGEILNGSSGGHKARKILEEREGPPPFPKAVCRHLCENDSMAHKRENGFVCTLHTTWGTAYENKMDQSTENRAKGPRIGGRISGRIAVENGQLASVASKGGKISANRPDNSNKLKVTCPYCCKTGQKMTMARWHFDNCRHKPPN